VISILAVALLLSVCLLQNWPRRRETENPMARYRKSIED
jgi:hypothetical protein